MPVKMLRRMEGNISERYILWRIWTLLRFPSHGPKAAMHGRNFEDDFGVYSIGIIGGFSKLIKLIENLKNHNLMYCTMRERQRRRVEGAHF